MYFINLLLDFMGCYNRCCALWWRSLVFQSPCCIRVEQQHLQLFALLSTVTDRSSSKSPLITKSIKRLHLN